MNLYNLTIFIIYRVQNLYLIKNLLILLIIEYPVLLYDLDRAHFACTDLYGTMNRAKTSLANDMVQRIVLFHIFNRLETIYIFKSVSRIFLADAVELIPQILYK